jgi:HTH-type transcriptional regulator, competence development regulator
MAEKNESLGRQLRRVRTMRKLSLRDVEDATGISNPYLSQLENDKISKPSPHFLHKLAKLYGVEYEMLMEAAGYVHERQQAGGAATLTGAALFSDKNITAEEEVELAKYLQFLRTKNK